MINHPANTGALTGLRNSRNYLTFNNRMKNGPIGGNMPYIKLYYHIIWGTKNREPRITPELEDKLHSYIAKKAIGLGGIVHALNGTADHVHLAVTIPTTIQISKFIGQVKGVASTRINKSSLGDGQFFWQSEYSIFSFSERELPYIVRYINNQKDHHKHGTEIETMESFIM
jgi:REP element-mobilizing transposase RayT